MTPEEMREKRVQVAQFALTYVKEALMQPPSRRVDRPNSLSKLSGEATATANLESAEGVAPWDLEGGIAQLWYAAADRAFRDLLIAGHRTASDWPTRDISAFRDAWRTFPDMEIDRGPLFTMLAGLGVDLDIVNTRLLQAARKAGIVKDRADPRLDIYEHWLAEVQALTPSDKVKLQLERYNAFDKVARSVDLNGKETIYFT